uniref:Uncharacterized protein n=1 Tax=Tanacetum cinerariifolium TaxID=118510 RepID=A0A699HHB1_TANCI|nr:hypothetical protein [Tanacetum cinerariifolium]
MLYAQSRMEGDMLCRRQDDMGYNRLKFYMRCEMPIMRLLACHSMRHGFLPPSFRECVLIRGWSPQPAHLSAGAGTIMAPGGSTMTSIKDVNSFFTGYTTSNNLISTGKLSNLTVEERFAFNVSLRMFTRSIVIQRHVEDLQLGIESYQKRLNLTKPDTYRSDLKRRKAYTAYSNPRGFIYQNKDKKNRLIRIDELHKFSDGTLNDVRNALDDRLKGIRMQYFPNTIWRRGDKDRAAAMIEAIDQMLKTRRIMRSLERFVGGRQYEGDFRMLQRTI